MHIIKCREKAYGACLSQLKPSISFTIENMYLRIQTSVTFLLLKLQTSLKNNEKKMGQMGDFFSIASKALPRYWWWCIEILLYRVPGKLIRKVP